MKRKNTRSRRTGNPVVSLLGSVVKVDSFERQSFVLMLCSIEGQESLLCTESISSNGPWEFIVIIHSFYCLSVTIQQHYLLSSIRQFSLIWSKDSGCSKQDMSDKQVQIQKIPIGNQTKQTTCKLLEPFR
jgi:hypothetical protein